jgi:hypothetical protein
MAGGRVALSVVSMDVELSVHGVDKRGMIVYRNVLLKAISQRL